MRRIRTYLKNILESVLPNLNNKRNSHTDMPRTVALVNWENLGDFVLFSAVIREVRSNYPISRLIVVAQKENKELVKYCPYVDEWIWIKGHTKPKPNHVHGRPTSYMKKLILTYLFLLLKGRREIDLVIGPDWLLVEDKFNFTSNLLFKKVAWKSPNLRLGDISKYNNHSHQVTRMLSILSMYGLSVKSDAVETWPIPTPRIQIEKKQFSESGKDLRVVISLGAGQLRRNWPIENVKNLVFLLNQRFPEIEIEIIGPKSLKNSQVIQLLVGVNNVQNFVGRLDLAGVSKLLQKAHLFIGNDSGIAHMAAAYKVPCLVISAHPLDGDPWHLHSPKRYHPWNTDFKVLQPEKLLYPCVNSCQSNEPHCILAISPIESWRACCLLLGHSNYLN